MIFQTAAESSHRALVQGRVRLEIQFQILKGFNPIVKPMEQAACPTFIER